MTTEDPENAPHDHLVLLQRIEEMTLENARLSRSLITLDHERMRLKAENQKLSMENRQFRIARTCVLEAIERGNPMEIQNSVNITRQILKGIYKDAINPLLDHKGDTP